MTLNDWYGAGRRMPVALRGASWEIFVRVAGAGRWCTLFHGFPTASWDWHLVWPTLVARRRVLAFDFLGFGDSDKPADHTYDVVEQAELAIALWKAYGVTATDLVVHDYGVSVAQEILARHAEGSLGVELGRVTFLNGGVYPDLHRPQPAQIMLLDPERGPQLGDLITGESFAIGLRSTYARQPPEEELAAQWETVKRRDGHRIGYRLIQYIRDRQRHAERWVGALEHTTVPRHFIWGMLDPVSGGHMAERIAAHMPATDRIFLDDVGHWPQIEAPDVVQAQLARILTP
jgi:pimeloyl-ACP methyl ester carboxylesterase